LRKIIQLQRNVLAKDAPGFGHIADHLVDIEPSWRITDGGWGLIAA
jgi:hypothetical protein